MRTAFASAPATALALLALAAAAALAACGGAPTAGPPTDAAPCPVDAASAVPDDLADTGIEGPCVTAYEPRFWLWTDGAEKQRSVYLPTGASIDDSDVDEWNLPVGAKLWKEFVVDGKKVETRFLWHVEAGRYEMAAYLWSDDERSAFNVDTLPGLEPGQGVVNARGTAHDVPGSGACIDCHGTSKRPIGFAALQLASDLAQTNVGSLLDDARLSHTPRALPLPGDALDQLVLGALSANCGHCHGDGGQVDFFAMRLRQTTDAASLGRVEDTPFFTTTVGVSSEGGYGMNLIEPGDAERSLIYVRASRRDAIHGDAIAQDGMSQMPPLGTEQTDDVVLEALRAWIERLPR